MAEDVRFIRVRGRIVPIKGKGGSRGTKAQRAQKLTDRADKISANRSRVNKTFGTVGVAATALGALGALVGLKNKAVGKTLFKRASRMADRGVNKARGFHGPAQRGRSRAVSDEMHTKTMTSLTTQVNSTKTFRGTSTAREDIASASKFLKHANKFRNRAAAALGGSSIPLYVGAAATTVTAGVNIRSRGMEDKLRARAHKLRK